MKGKYKDWGFLHMELYYLYIDNDIETTKFADVFFEPESKYTGVAITGKLSRMITGNEIKFDIVRPILYARRGELSDSYFNEYHDLSMTELKQYLLYGNVTPNLSMLDSTIRNEINKIINGKPVNNKFKIINLGVKYRLYIQDSGDYQSYGHRAHVLIIESLSFDWFMEKVEKKMMNNE